MHFLNGKLMLSEGWKCYFRDPIFQNLPGEHAPGPPLAARALGTRDWPPNKSNLPTALLFLISSRVTRIYVSVSNTLVPYALSPFLSDGYAQVRQLQKEGGKELLQQTVKEQFEHESLLPEHKNTLRKFLQGQNAFVNYPTGFPLPSNRCRCTAHYGQF